MQPGKRQVNMVMDKTMWRKCDVAAAATMGGASASSFARFAIQAMLDLCASRDVALAGAFKLIDDAQDSPVAPVAQVSQVKVPA